MKKLAIAAVLIFALNGCAIQERNGKRVVVPNPQAAQRVEETAGILSRVLPPPAAQIAGIVGIIASIISGSAAAKQNKRRKETQEAARLIVKAIEVAKDNAGNVNFSNPETAHKLSMVMGDKGKQIVNQAQGKDRRDLP